MCAFISLHACLSHTFCPYLPTASDRFVRALYKLKGWALCQMLCKSLPSLSLVFIFYFPEKSFNLQLKSNLCIFFPYGINLCIFFFFYSIQFCDAYLKFLHAPRLLKQKMHLCFLLLFLWFNFFFPVVHLDLWYIWS